MISRLKSRLKYILVVGIQFFLGIYSCALNTQYLEANRLSDIFISIKCPSEFELVPEDFTVAAVLNIVNVIISALLIPMLVTKNYKSGCYYSAIRYGKYSRFYFGIMMQCAGLALLSELAFDTAAVLSAAIRFRDADMHIDRQMILLMLHSFIVILVFSLLGTILSLLISEKAGIFASVSLIVILAVVIFFLPNPIKQFDIIAWMHIEKFLSNREIFTISKQYYYAFAAAILCTQYYFGLHLLKKNTL